VRAVGAIVISYNKNKHMNGLAEVRELAHILNIYIYARSSLLLMRPVFANVLAGWRAFTPAPCRLLQKYICPRSKLFLTYGDGTASRALRARLNNMNLFISRQRFT